MTTILERFLAAVRQATKYNSAFQFAPVCIH